MKTSKIFSALGAAVILTALSGCSEEQSLPAGEGKIYVTARVNSDIVVVSRAEAEEDLAASTQIWISSAQGVVRKYNSMSELPPQGITLINGEYTVQAWAGKVAYASFTDRWFEGSETVEIGAGDRKSIEVVCHIANVCASVNYDPEVAQRLSDAVMTIGTRGGSLDFEGTDDTRRGYYMMPEATTSLDWTLTATADGKQFTKTGTIENVEPAHEYRLNIVSNAEFDEIGGAWIQIEVDDTMIESEDNIIIAAPPSIIGSGFDLSKPVTGEAGSIGLRNIFVSSSCELTDVEIHGLPEIDDFDFVRATDEVIAELAELGFTSELTDHEQGAQIMKVTFGEKFLNSLENREEPYVFEIFAQDINGKQATANFTLKISEAPIYTTPADPEKDATYNSVTFHGDVSKDGIEAVGFEYRVKDSDDDWTYTSGQAQSRAAWAKGDTYFQTIEFPDANMREVEYRATCGSIENPTEFKAEIMTIHTKPTPQLPNSDMEQWSNSGTKNCVIPAPSANDAFWDCGNHGSITMGKNVTDKTTEKRHNGTYAAKLQSEFVGLGSIGKLAAGNICVGKYLKTDGTDGVFGFGRAFDFDGLRPTALRLWMHYTPVAVTHTGSGATLSKGDMDMGHIFVALFDETDPDTADGVAPFIVRTKAKNAKYFDKNASWIMAYGERILTEATPGNDMVELTIPIEYKAGAESRIPRYITIVCTASKEGDYYTGGSGSTLYVDDFQLLY
ncbi:MAG: DUF4493 domain-containing protein [Bacteroidales bacterium]|nr:DUF4493 domain-containing protein [Bacteroidales bacterium]MBD5342068.1 DUF4493 domain-containing protein [Bacteroides sp.]